MSHTATTKNKVADHPTLQYVEALKQMGEAEGLEKHLLSNEYRFSNPYPGYTHSSPNAANHANLMTMPLDSTIHTDLIHMPQPVSQGRSIKQADKVRIHHISSFLESISCNAVDCVSPNDYAVRLYAVLNKQFDLYAPLTTAAAKLQLVKATYDSEDLDKLPPRELVSRVKQLQFALEELQNKYDKKRVRRDQLKQTLNIAQSLRKKMADIKQCAEFSCCDGQEMIHSFAKRFEEIAGHRIESGMSIVKQRQLAGTAATMSEDNPELKQRKKVDPMMMYKSMVGLLMNEVTNSFQDNDDLGDNTIEDVETQQVDGVRQSDPVLRGCDGIERAVVDRACEAAVVIQHAGRELCAAQHEVKELTKMVQSLREKLKAAAEAAAALAEGGGSLTPSSQSHLGTVKAGGTMSSRQHGSSMVKRAASKKVSQLKAATAVASSASSDDNNASAKGPALPASPSVTQGKQQSPPSASAAKQPQQIKDETLKSGPSKASSSKKSPRAKTTATSEEKNKNSEQETSADEKTTDEKQRAATALQAKQEEAEAERQQQEEKQQTPLVSGSTSLTQQGPSKQSPGEATSTSQPQAQARDLQEPVIQIPTNAFTAKERDVLTQFFDAACGTPQELAQAQVPRESLQKLRQMLSAAEPTHSTPLHSPLDESKLSDHVQQDKETTQQQLQEEKQREQEASAFDSTAKPNTPTSTPLSSPTGVQRPPSRADVSQPQQQKSPVDEEQQQAVQRVDKDEEKEDGKKTKMRQSPITLQLPSTPPQQTLHHVGSAASESSLRSEEGSASPASPQRIEILYPTTPQQQVQQSPTASPIGTAGESPQFLLFEAKQRLHLEAVAERERLLEASKKKRKLSADAAEQRAKEGAIDRPSSSADVSAASVDVAQLKKLLHKLPALNLRSPHPYDKTPSRSGKRGAGNETSESEKDAIATDEVTDQSVKLEDGVKRGQILYDKRHCSMPMPNLNKAEHHIGDPVSKR